MSSNNLNKLKKQYEEQEIIPSADLWSRLEAKLEEPIQENPVAKPGFGWWKYAAAILIVISMGYFVLYQDAMPIQNSNAVVENHVDKLEQQHIEEEASTTFQAEKHYAENKEVTVETPESGPILDRKVKNPSLEPQKNIVETKSVQKSEKYDFEESIIRSNNSEVITPQIDNKPAIVSIPERQIENVSYIKADELLFSREINAKRNGAQKQSAHLVDFDLQKIKRRKPSSFKILGMELIQDDQDIH